MTKIIAQTTFKVSLTTDVDGKSVKVPRKFIRGMEYVGLTSVQLKELMELNDRDRFFLTEQELKDKEKTVYSAKNELALYKESLDMKAKELEIRENELNDKEKALRALERNLMTKQTKKTNK